MGLNSDGTATCDRCGLALPGYGVIYGMVCQSLDPVERVDRIYCYENACRDFVLEGLVNVPQVGDPVCTACGVALATWGVSEAMLAADLDPSGTGLQRQMAFCYVNRDRDVIVTRAAS